MAHQKNKNLNSLVEVICYVSLLFSTLLGYIGHELMYINKRTRSVLFLYSLKMKNKLLRKFRNENNI